MKTTLHRYFALASLAALLSWPVAAGAADFATGSLIIPMGTTYQDTGMLQAFGLVYRLLSLGIPVHQVIQPGKGQGGSDFTANAADVQTATIISAHGYRGGPYVVDATHAAGALAAVNDWHSEGHVTAVHQATAPFSGTIARTLRDLPGIAVLADGNELIAFQYLNAAGIPDGIGQAWPTVADLTREYPGYPDILSDAEIAGPSASGPGDGALFGPRGTATYCHLISAHYSIALNPEVVRETRQWLDFPESHLYLQCLSITLFENSIHGHFLTTNGLVDDGGIPNPLRFWEPDHPLAQFDGPFAADAGTVNSIGLAPGSSFRTNEEVLIEEDRGQTVPNLIQIVLLAGYQDGNTARGRVTYLAGHDYSTQLPITANTQTNGVRLFLNQMFDGTCAATQVVSVDGPARDGSATGLRIWSAPEPFLGAMQVGYALPADGEVRIRVFDLRGRHVRTLFEGRQTAGLHEAAWDGRRASGLAAPSGVYWVRVETPFAAGTKRISLLR